MPRLVHGQGAPGSEPAGGTLTSAEAHVQGRSAQAPRWQAVVWNDPVNLMSYVEYVFRSYFGYSRDKANALMNQVHHEGQAVVSAGAREAIEMDVRAMHEFGLQATLRSEDS